MNQLTPDPSPQDSLRVIESIRIAWEQGETRLLEELCGAERLRGLPAAQLLDLVYEEFLARRRAGQSPTADEYVTRFPEQRAAIRRLFDLHQEIGESRSAQVDPDGAELTRDQLIKAFRDWRSHQREPTGDEATSRPDP